MRRDTDSAVPTLAELSMDLGLVRTMPASCPDGLRAFTNPLGTR
jgi:hypothetical protein